MKIHCLIVCVMLLLVTGAGSFQESPAPVAVFAILLRALLRVGIRVLVLGKAALENGHVARLLRVDRKGHLAGVGRPIR